MGITPGIGSSTTIHFKKERNDGSGLGSVEVEYKSIRMKAAVKLFEN